MRAALALRNNNVQLAATLVMVRDTEAGLEVYMTERPGGIDFADLHVFPGGKVAAADDDWLLESDQRLLGQNGSSADAALGEQQALRYWVAAIRESFEECGVLYARDANGRWLGIGARERARFSEYREALIEQRMTLSELCAATDTVLDASGLLYFSHWLTPEAAPRRFDTRFFLARMLPDQATAEHHREVVSGAWVAPRQALANAQEGQWQLISPTRITLESLLPFASSADLWQAVRANRHLPVLTDALRREGMCELRGS
ncbi:MAG: hypothetical protein AB8B93_02620 [Pseudomonadales bacterium]